MVALFETDALFVTLTSAAAKARQDYTLLDGAGREVASAVCSSKPGARALRLFHLRATGRYDWDLLDGGGNRLLAITKPASDRSPDVSLADGSPLGRAVATRDDAVLERPDGTALGRLAWSLGERRSHPVLMYRVLDEQGAEVGEVSHQTEGQWGFHVTFRPDADLAVRALSIAWTICKAQERTT